MHAEATDWKALADWARPHLATLLDVQVKPDDRPVTSAAAGWTARRHHPRPLPGAGEPMPAILAELLDAVLASGYCNGAHPQYFGYFHPRPLPAAVLGDAVAALLNQSPAGWRFGAAAAALECETLTWLADFTGFGPPVPAAASLPGGVFTSSGSLANLAALKLARDTILGRAVQSRGMANAPPAAVYMSAEAHFSVIRALDVLGLGRSALRSIPTDARGRVDPDALAEHVTRDVTAGVTPLCVIGLAGATATGAVDPLDTLAEIARAHGMWFHIDGAAGAVFADLDPTRALFRGLARADSLTIDPHKWLFVPYGLGCLLVRDGRELARGFAGGSHFFEARDDLDMLFMSPEGARPWKSLGLWLAFRQLGRTGYARLLTQQLEVACYLAGRVTAHPDLALFVPPSLPVCCFRLRAAGDGPASDALHQRIRDDLQARGTHYLTTCQLGGATHFRVAINNYATTPAHIDDLLAALHASWRRLA
jgi:L-2,4-diaminobutyrate decarboxylase